MSEPQIAESLLEPGHNCCAIAHADRAALLIDGEAYFNALMLAAQRAERSITILAWDFDSRTRLSDDPALQVPRMLGDFLNHLARRRRRLQIHILDWDYPVIFGKDREFSPLYGLNWSPHRRVHLKYDDTHPVAGSHHQKIVVIDDKLAFVGGMDLTCKRWDTRAHLPNDPRRISGTTLYPPFHDAMAMVDGAAARALTRIAQNRWLRATGHKLPEVVSAGDPWPPAITPTLRDVQIGVACTSPEREVGKGVRDIEQLYLDMIARAKRHIYIENQYFTSYKVADALAARLSEADPPEVVLLIRLLSHGWLEEMTMHVLRTRLIEQLRKADHRGRFQVYYPHVEGLTAESCIDVHTKLMAVDDEWLRVGSANLSNRSMGLDTECDVVFEACGQTRVTDWIRAQRANLLAEHLGASTDAVLASLAQTQSMHKTIEALGSAQRGLKVLEHLQQWSDAAIATASVADMETPVSLEHLVAQFTPEHDETKRSRIPWLKLALAIIVVGGLTALWRYTPLAQMITADRVSQWAEAASGKWWAPLALMAFYTPACVIMFPRPLITLAAVIAFGPWLGFTYAITGIEIAALATYFAGRLVHRDTVRRIAGERLNRLSHILCERGLVAAAAIRLVPIAPFAAEGLVAGAIGMKLWHYALGSFIGVLPGVLAATVFGNQIEAALRDPSSVDYWMIAVFVALLVAGLFFVRRWFLRMEHAQGNAPLATRKTQAAQS